MGGSEIDWLFPLCPVAQPGCMDRLYSKLHVAVRGDSTHTPGNIYPGRSRVWAPQSVGDGIIGHQKMRARQPAALCCFCIFLRRHLKSAPRNLQGSCNFANLRVSFCVLTVRAPSVNLATRIMARAGASFILRLDLCPENPIACDCTSSKDKQEDQFVWCATSSRLFMGLSRSFKPRRMHLRERWIDTSWKEMAVSLGIMQPTFLSRLPEWIHLVVAEPLRLTNSRRPQGLSERSIPAGKKGGGQQTRQRKRNVRRGAKSL